jgi:hypothetical protein
MAFKIIAVEPLNKCHEDYYKALKPGEIYYFYHNYSITKKKITEEVDELVPSHLFTVHNKQQVSISAVVGKNGSGKSSIVELLYGAVFNAACVAKVLERDDATQKLKPLPDLHVQIYYQKDDNYYRLRCAGRSVILYCQVGKDGVFPSSGLSIASNKANLTDLFYTIAINFSLHSLNASLPQNKWLAQLFHKNDGYQTPLVINPFRDDGKIDINNENYLTQSRLVSNLLAVRKEGNVIFDELLPGKKATRMLFRPNRAKVEFNKSDFNLPKVFDYHRQQMLDLIALYFPIPQHARQRVGAMRNYIDMACSYLYKKLYNITRLYRPYQDADFAFINLNVLKISRSKQNPEDIKHAFDPKKLEKLLKKMRDNPSHITFKFRQTINFINNIELYHNRIGKWINIVDFAKAIDQVSKRTKEALITLIPPPFFTVDIEFGTKGRLQLLSSGEKQNIFNSTAWVYHLLNLISVREDPSSGYNRYACVNLIFDEIELYYHPEMQRTFIKDFLSTMKRIPVPRNMKINCIFITHSPFILSDIPNHHILFLTENGLPDPAAADRRTFGANIHDLLKNNFFLKEGTIGAFAQQKIKDLISFLEGKPTTESAWDKPSADQFINLIAEPLVRTSLRQLYHNKFGRNRAELQKQMELIQKELNSLP